VSSSQWASVHANFLLTRCLYIIQEKNMQHNVASNNQPLLPTAVLFDCLSVCLTAVRRVPRLQHRETRCLPAV